MHDATRAPVDGSEYWYAKKYGPQPVIPAELARPHTGKNYTSATFAPTTEFAIRNSPEVADKAAAAIVHMCKTTPHFTESPYNTVAVDKGHTSGRFVIRVSHVRCVWMHMCVFLVCSQLVCEHCVNLFTPSCWSYPSPSCNGILGFYTRCFNSLSPSSYFPFDSFPAPAFAERVKPRYRPWQPKPFSGYKG